MGCAGRFGWALGRWSRTIPLALAAGAVLAAPALAFYEDAEVRAILFSREKADTLGAPLVLMAHQTSLHMLGNGARDTEEHWIWYVADPSAPVCARVQRLAVLVDRTLETFGLRHCRIFRGDDTLHVEQGRWQSEEPRDWPPGGSDPFREIAATLPPLEHGDVIELAYVVKNPWSTGLFPTDWVMVPLTDAAGPTIERHVKLTHNAAMNARLGVLNSDARIIEHLGAQPPQYELLTGNLPPGPADPSRLDAPRFLFTSHTGWGSVRAAFARHCATFLTQAERMFAATGDSLAAAQPSSRARLQGVLDHLNGHVRHVARPMTASTYYPRNAQVCYRLGSADRLEWALLGAALATAAKVRVEIYAARDSLAGFDPTVPNPAQFDHVLLRALLAEEDRTVVFDPWGGDFAAGLRSRVPLLLPLGGAEQNFFELVEGDDYLVPLSF